MSKPEDRFVVAFVEEAAELLADTEEALLALEAAPDDMEIVGRIFRAMHTIKGSSAIVGCKPVAEFTHHVETLLDRIRNGKIGVTQDVIDLVLQSRDHIANLVSAVATGTTPESAPGQRILDAIKAYLPDSAAGGGESHRAEPAARDVAPNASPTAYHIRFAPHAAIFASGTDPAMLLDELRGLGECEIVARTEDVPVLPDLQPEQCFLYWDIVLRTTRGRDAIREVFVFVEEDSDLTITEMTDSAPDEDTSAQRQLGVFARSASQHVESILTCGRKWAEGERTDAIASAWRRAVKSLLGASEYMELHEFAHPCNEILNLLEPLLADNAAWDKDAQARFEQHSAELVRLLEQVQRAAAPPTRKPRLGDVLVSQGVVAREEVEAALSSPQRIGDVLVGQGLVSREKVEEVAESLAGGPSPKTATIPKTMRVDSDKLDDYINLSGELLIARNGLLHTVRELESGRATVQHLKDAVERVDRITSEIQANAMAMRMIPVKSVFQRFPRLIRDIARAQSKQIELRLAGEDTELDKQIAEALVDPLVHLVRNAADHGIEPPDVRRAAGKPETGVVTLSAGREGNSIVIDIKDDGAGIRVARLKARAVEKGLITAEQAEQMPRKAALELIFAAGLSTATVVSDISGRGVGMDVVRNSITKLNGSISVSSEEGQGTHVRVQLPLTLAVTTVVLVGCRGNTFALPIESVNESVKIAPAEVHTLKGEYAFSLRGEVIPLKPLSGLLGLQYRGEDVSDELAGNLSVDSTGMVPIAVVTAGATRFGLIVDEFKGQQEIVVKPLARCLAQLPGLGGATIMGDGTVVLVLDPVSLFALASRRRVLNDAKLAESVA